jgi:transcriptional regulator with XRE-family HTH domain
MSDFHARLNESIARSGLTQDEISSRSGVSIKTIQNWTRAAGPTMPRIDQGVMVAVVLEVSAEYLVTGRAPAGITAAALEIAMAADKLNAEGKRVALNQVEGLLNLYPLGDLRPTKTAG